MSARIRLFSFAVMALGLVLGVSAASAQENAATAGAADAPSTGKTHSRQRMRGHRRSGMRELRGIKLNDAQKEQIRIIRETYKPSRQEMDEMRMLRKAKHDGTITEDQKVRMESLHTAQKQRMETIRTQVMGILTPDQKAEIEKSKADREKRWAERRERMQKRSPRPDMDSPKPQDDGQ